ncbi:MAG TPA: cytochrome c oxidase subunit 3 [Terriglobales bacterium]|nr:cytochrome c oxidase subunit 3 [Terriglobales bacterium]
MPVLSQPITIEKPQSGQGHGGLHPPQYGGGGDYGPGDGAPDYERRLRQARLGLLFAMGSITVLFLTATIVLLMRQGAVEIDNRTPTYIYAWAQVSLPVRLLLWNTLVLLLSSIAMELARRTVARELVLAPVRQIPGIMLDSPRGVLWTTLTALLGLVFLAGQWRAWQAFRTAAIHLGSQPSPFFYILTGGHALHLAGGISALLYAVVVSLTDPRIERRHMIVELTGWYWHFLGVLWVYVFVILEFGR